jgi:TolB protein
LLTIARRDDASLALINLEGANQAVPLAEYSSFIFPVGYSPDGSKLAGVTSMGRAEKIVLVSRDDGGVTMLNDLERCQASPDWAPGSNQLAFVANPEIQWDMFIQEQGSTRPRRAVHTERIDEYQPSWSHDGRHLAYVGVEVDSDDSLIQDIYTLNVSTGEILRLTDSEGEHESLPLWSPRGDKLAYLSLKDNQWYLFTMKPDGSGRVQVATISQ